MNRLARWILVGLCMALILVIGVPVSAQTTWPELQVEPSWGMRTRAGWTELRVTVMQGGGEPWQGELVIENPREEITYRVPLDLPAQTHKVYRVPVFVGDSVSLRLTLRDSKKNEKPVQNLAFTSIPDEQRFCVVVSSQPVSVSWLCDVVSYLERPDDLPEWIPAWDSVDVLFWDGVSSTELTLAQQQAMETWVAMGGQLIIGGGDALRGALEGLPPVLRIASVSGPARTLDAFPLPDVPSQTWIVSPLQRTTDEAQSLLTLEDGQPVAFKQALGLGEVIITGARLGLLTQTTWLRTLVNARAVPAIVLPFVQSPWGRAAAMNVYPGIWDLFQFSKEALPAVRGLFFFLVPLIYVLLMGPLAWFVVRRTHRPLLAWVLLPAVTLGVTLIVFVILSTAQVGVFPLEHTMSIVLVPDPRVPARAIHHTAFYAPQWRMFTFETTRWTRPWLGAYVTSNYYGTTGDFFPVEITYQNEGAHVQMRELDGVVTWAEEEIFAAPSLKAELSIVPSGGDYTLQGTLSSAQALEDVYLIWGASQLAYSIGSTLPAGQNTRINQGLMPVALPQSLISFIEQSSAPMYYGGPSPKPKPVSYDSGCFIVGTTNHSKTGGYALIGKGRQAHEQIWVYRVPCPGMAGTSQVEELVINPAQWVVASTDHWLEENQWLPVNSYEAMSSIDYVAYLPLEFREVETLTIDLTMRFGSKPAEVIRAIEAYDRKAEDWIELPKSLLTDGTLTLEGEDAMRFVSSGLPRMSLRVYNRTSATGTTDYVSFALTLRARP